ncbi:MAG: metallophosphoesterase [Desulfovibrionaceae bacterium]
MNRRIFAVGDIHGRMDRLGALLGRLRTLDPEARWVFLGDYFDRGPQSREVVDALLALRAERPDTVCLLGNHEAALLRYAASCSPEDLRLLRAMGFQATLDSYGRAPGACGLDFMSAAHRAFLEGLEPWRVLGNYVFCHAPIAPDAAPDRAEGFELERLLSGRLVDAAGWAADGRTLVFGHVPLATPLVAPGLIGLDTGEGDMLTAVELPAVRFHHA